MKLIDMTGQRHGRWTVLQLAPPLSGKATWLCRCDCGTERAVRARALRAGASSSCGLCGSGGRPAHGLGVGRWSYFEAHKKVRRRRGRAADRACGWSDCAEPADEWGLLIGSSPEHEHLAPDNDGARLLRFSTDPGAYLAMCRSCHAAWDAVQTVR